MSVLCIYHGNCADGFGAAWVVHEALVRIQGRDDVRFHAGVYGNPPPDVTGEDVIIVDFSYKRPVLDEMAKSAASILIIDHHRTAAEDLAGIPKPVGGWKEHIADRMRQDPMQWTFPPYVRAIFDMESSGALLTWFYFAPGQMPPRLLDHIEDRDLWRFKLEGTREIQAALFSYPYDFDVWRRLIYNTKISKLIADGQAIKRKHFKDIDELLDVTLRYMVIGGHRVPVANLPYTMTSDAGHKLAEGNPFAACYWDTPDGRVFSLRSNGGVDVSEIAKAYGGGGHRNASGFRMPIGWEGDGSSPERGGE